MLLFFFIRISKFFRGSLFLIFWLFQPQFDLNLFLFLWVVWNDEKSKQKDKALRNNTADRLYFEISVHLSNKWEMVLLCFYCAHCKRKLQDSVKFQLEIFSLFFQPHPELILKLFFNFRPMSTTILKTESYKENLSGSEVFRLKAPALRREKTCFQ